MPAPTTTCTAVRPGGRDLGLDALRGLAALLVVVFHVAGSVRFNAIDHVGAVTGRLKVGVPIFFALSGFLLYRQLFAGRPREGYARYALRRVARIAPAYWLALVVLAVMPAFAAAAPHLDVSGEDRAWVYFAFVQVFSPDTVNHGIAPAWSLTSELLFYLGLPAFALVLATLRRRSGPRALSVELAVLAGAALGCVGLALLLGPQRAAHPNLISTPVMNALWFVPGMAWAALGELRPGLWRSGRARLTAAGVAVGTFGALCAWVPRPPGNRYEALPALLDYVGFGVVAGGLLVAFGGLRVQGARGWLLHPLAAVGTVSFGVYLWHVPILAVVRDRGPAGWRSEHDLLGALAWVLPLSLLVGAASWFLVERPVLRVASRRRRPSRSPATARRPTALRGTA